MSDWGNWSSNSSVPAAAAAANVDISDAAETIRAETNSVISSTVTCRSLPFLSTALKPTILFKSIMQILKLKQILHPCKIITVLNIIRIILVGICLPLKRYHLIRPAGILQPYRPDQPLHTIPEIECQPSQYQPPGGKVKTQQ